MIWWISHFSPRFLFNTLSKRRKMRWDTNTVRREMYMNCTVDYSRIRALEIFNRIYFVRGIRMEWAKRFVTWTMSCYLMFGDKKKKTYSKQMKTVDASLSRANFGTFQSTQRSSRRTIFFIRIGVCRRSYLTLRFISCN